MTATTFRPIISIDLSKPIAPIRFDDALNGIYLIAWWRSFPLAHKSVECQPNPLSPAQIASLLLPDVAHTVEAYCAKSNISPQTDLSNGDDPLANLNSVVSQLDGVRPQSAAGTNTPTVSIVIPTINRPEMLAKCLRSLENLEQTPLEIIVVDNDPSTRISADVVQRFPQVAYLPQPEIGASCARNLGVQHSSGDIIAFVDDDEQVDPCWLSRLLDGFSRPEVGCTTGLVLPNAIETPSQDFFETRFSFVRGYSPITFDQTFFQAGSITGVPVWKIGGSGNMAVRRGLFLAVGGFDERLGGGHAGCSEDTEFFYRLLTLGWHIAYLPQAVCYHDHRIDPQGLEKQIFSYMRGHVTALLVQFVKYKNASNLVRLGLILPFFYLKYLLRSLSKDPDYPLWVWRLEVSGCLSGLAYFWRNRAFWLTKQPALQAATGKTNRFKITTV